MSSQSDRFPPTGDTKAAAWGADSPTSPRRLGPGGLWSSQSALCKHPAFRTRAATPATPSTVNELRSRSVSLLALCQATAASLPQKSRSVLPPHAIRRASHAALPFRSPRAGQDWNRKDRTQTDRARKAPAERDRAGPTEKRPRPCLPSSRATFLQSSNRPALGPPLRSRVPVVQTAWRLAESVPLRLLRLRQSDSRRVRPNHARRGIRRVHSKAGRGRTAALAARFPPAAHAPPVRQ